MTVTGLTSRRDFLHLGQNRERRTHKIRSGARSRSRFLLLLCSTMSWWRSARISSCREACVRSVHLRAANIEISMSSMAQDDNRAKRQAQRSESLRSFWQPHLDRIVHRDSPSMICARNCSQTRCPSARMIWRRIRRRNSLQKGYALINPQPKFPTAGSKSDWVWEQTMYNPYY